MRRVCLAGVVVLLGGLIVAPLAQTHAPAVSPLAATLRETGLYSDWDTKTVAPGHLRFAPQYPLWTDGAAKSRWLHLPPDSWIDASNPDAWEFPVGTKVWKEFRFHGAPAETRMIERTTEGWRYASYAWRPDGSATLVSERGILNSVEIANGVRHAIPSRTDCTACHEAGPSRLLSVSALQLSSDRDPLAPHAEPLPEGAVTLQTLVDRGLVRNLPMQLARSAPRIAAASPVERAALGYLHGNCGMCHTGAGEMASLGFVLQYPLAQAVGASAPALGTSLAQPSHFQAADRPDLRDRIAPGNPDASMLLARMDSRHPVLQMPPLGSRIVDAEAVALLRRWIAEGTGSSPHTRASAR
ncbi:hypothetical protein LuPra_00764 [Luteitalea pratensis]|uniref:Cytochrome c domain-containing protein n=1 Tax=Luteitalea pratensis TaxID=1855912 RepID=A0A143PGF0_LUTPR|nr:hypothetical protein [Luteitalea pratensis]AMY07591.1 hypothetical protein LuPra_00764 [Luteitalea pratensis]